ncbi:MAG: hypothetical protein A2512_10835 [Deltaproteobacteria bacterium RIFOXYD12_FULL_56_24]|nr:MAG: hypothetical protein A2512_10835 [Deltaproteobacteria bacterium RIFOXYD12_FULL_56_24]
MGKRLRQSKEEGKINILYFTSFGTLKGGGQRSLFYLLRGLNRDIFNPVVVCPEQGDLVDQLQVLGIDTMVMPFKRFRQLSVGFVWRIFCLIRERRINLVHTDAPAETFYAGIAARLAGVPLIWHIRVSDAGPADRLLAALATRLFMVASSLRTRFPSTPADKLVPIINGIDVAEFDARPPIGIRQEIGVGSGPLLIGCVGRLEEMKGQEYLVRAVQLLSGRGGDFRVLLIGSAEGDYREKLIALMRELKVEEYFIDLGFRHDTPGLLKELDFLVSASSFGEGLSRVILEAMAAGKPVVATAIGGAAEAVDEGVTGYVVPPRDPQALAEAMLRLLTSPERRHEFGTLGRRRVEEQFCLADNIATTQRFYLEILQRGR